MKYSELKAIVDILQSKKRLVSARRVDDNRLSFRFENESWIADFGEFEGGVNGLFSPVDRVGGDREFNAPFDKFLTSAVNQSAIEKITIGADDKIVFLTLAKSDGWKEIKTTLVLEFVPRRLNALLLDQNGVILESLKRTTALQIPYVPPPAPPFKPKIEPIADIRAFMRMRLAVIDEVTLKRKKSVAISYAIEKARRLRAIIADLLSPEALEKAATIASEEGALILANLNKIAPYSSSAAIEDFEGKTRTIALELLRTPQQEAERKFARAKKWRAKASGVFQERQSLEERAAFYDRLVLGAAAAENLDELETIMPKKQRQNAKKSAKEPIEEFIIGGFRALLGRNEKGNALLLKRAKARDVWFHLQGRPSAHLIVQTAKAELPDEAIEKAAKLCARFSLSEKGDYLVDYTKRQFVKIEYGAHVTYSRQKSVVVRLD
ncbi:MAG: NFACT family protein [Helicobacteraceae bacterium]|jgi:predicted ribosome quality control (RQC) complex YloA/Tae2 family protein|nr:NFACT family protein [Helicobacteraceae bacterium]